MKSYITTLRAVFALIVLSIGVLFLGCKSSDNVRVGALFPFLDEGSRWSIEKKHMTETAQRLGVEFIARGASASDVEQYNQALELIEKKVDVLLVAAINMNTAAAIVREAKKRNIPVIAYDRMIYNADVDFYISNDYYAIGKMMAEYAIKNKPNGNYVVFWGDRKDNNAVNLKKGQMEVLAPLENKGQINILFKSFTADWNGAIAGHNLDKVITALDEPVDVLLSSNDGIANECIKFLDKYDLIGKTLVTGMDAELTACRNVAQGKQTMTLYKPLKVSADFGISVAIKMAKGEDCTQGTTLVDNNFKKVAAKLFKGIIVDKDNFEEVILENQVYRHEEIYGSK